VSDSIQMIELSSEEKCDLWFVSSASVGLHRLWRVVTVHRVSLKLNCGFVIESIHFSVLTWFSWRDNFSYN